MYPPQLTITSGREVASSMHGQDVVANQQITLLPSVVVRYATVVQETVKGIAYRLAALPETSSRSLVFIIIVISVVIIRVVYI